MYITAELDSHLPEQFLIGDENVYNGYYNAPLQTGKQYRVYLRAVSVSDSGVSHGQALC